MIFRTSRLVGPMYPFPLRGASPGTDLQSRCLDDEFGEHLQTGQSPVETFHVDMSMNHIPT